MKSTRTKVLVIQIVFLIIGFISYTLVHQAILSVISVGFALFLGFSLRFNTVISLCFTTITMLATPVLFFQILPPIAADFGAQILLVGIFLSVMSLSISLYLLRRGGSDAALPIRDVSWRLILFSFVGFVAALLIAQFVLSNHLSWIMRNDAVWNTASARFVITDGGRITTSHPNAAPMTVWILAIFMFAGRGMTSTAQLLQHDLSAVSGTLLFLTFITSLLAVFLVLKSISKTSIALRIAVAILVAIIPLSWFYLGYQASFGFFNTAIALLVLLSSWAIWTERDEIGVLIYPFLFITSIVLLVTWGPLVLITFGLLFAVALTRRKSMFKSLRELLIAGISAVVIVVYFLMFTLPNIKSNGSALSSDGGFFDFKPQYFVAILFLTLSLGYVSSLYANHRHFMGLVYMGVFGAMGVAVLTLQRRDMPEIWGYYPAKMAWILAMLFIILVCVFTGQIFAAAVHEKSNFNAFIAITLITGIVFSSMLLSGPPSPRDLIAPISAFSKSGLGNHSQLVPVISELAAPGSKNIVARYAASPDEDLFMNNWLLQMQSENDKDPIRWFSYFLNGSDTEMICNAIDAWGQGVTIQTRDPLLEKEILTTCPKVDFELKLHD